MPLHPLNLDSHHNILLFFESLVNPSLVQSVHLCLNDFPLLWCLFLSHQNPTCDLPLPVQQPCTVAMAFPYQFGSLADLETCQDSKFLIYCNHFLPQAERLRHWYQYANLYLVGFAASVPLTLWTVQYFWHAWRHRRLHKRDPIVGVVIEEIFDRETVMLPNFSPSRLSDQTLGGSGTASPKAQPLYNGKTSEASRDSSVTLRNSQVSTAQPYIVDSPTALGADVRKSMQSINLRSEDDATTNPNQSPNYDLVMIPLFAETENDSPRSSTSPPASISRSAPAKTLVGLFEMQDLGPGALSSQATRKAAITLNERRAEKGCAGLVLHLINRDTCTTQIIELLHELCHLQVGVVLMCDPDTKALQHINFGLLVGTVFENACILDNGARRNFFQTVGLREMMGRCAKERLLRPTFLVKFLDLWSVQPTAAVARRAHKLAEYFGASFEHGAVAHQGWAARAKCPTSLSAFDYLKRSEVVEVSRARIRKSRSKH
jgi:hypothetical protein